MHSSILLHKCYGLVGWYDLWRLLELDYRRWSRIIDVVGDLGFVYRLLELDYLAGRSQPIFWLNTGNCKLGCRGHYEPLSDIAV